MLGEKIRKEANFMSKLWYETCVLGFFHMASAYLL